MPVHSLDHANIRTTNLEAMIAFYEDVLDMTNGPRADFDFPGAWLYLGDTAVVHLVGVEGNPQTEGDLALEHAAFRATDLAAFMAKLKTRGVDHYLGFPPGVPIVQVNIHDPDGNHLHVDFHIDELEAAGLSR
ncbi:glyoxalase/bleomycin resistance protein/dioxygenase superfamily protein [Shimia isoporae]|uniref:Glyoxalase/bleomycin resistance protein/dioxygenase superfamily protein n=1 Tax=Shimia isoporae TaxID=647720 RepID=A0A4R1N8U1_9RHOB|nr:VOC family protein [Shimia isoporae]TCK99312.1 glyoxalase/bleomycin resistance protein/dioxygenase superfamily protein [Shimia isoporae]